MSELALIFLPGRKPPDEAPATLNILKSKVPFSCKFGGTFFIHLHLFSVIFIFFSSLGSITSFLRPGDGYSLSTTVRENAASACSCPRYLPEKSYASPWVLLLLFSCKDQIYSFSFSCVHMFSPLLGIMF